jgi:hypothetical protein
VLAGGECATRRFSWWSFPLKELKGFILVFHTFLLPPLVSIDNPQPTRNDSCIEPAAVRPEGMCCACCCTVACRVTCAALYCGTRSAAAPCRCAERKQLHVGPVTILGSVSRHTEAESHTSQKTMRTLFFSAADCASAAAEWALAWLQLLLLQAAQDV